MTRPPSPRHASARTAQLAGTRPSPIDGTRPASIDHVSRLATRPVGQVGR